jgi:hypothetical protein
MFVCMIVWGARANQRHTRHHRSSRVCEWSLHVRTRVCWQLACMLIQVDKQRTDTFMHIREAYIRLCFRRKKRKEISTGACMHMHVCMHVPTAAQPHLKGVRACTTCVSVCVATISLIHPLCLSVCLSVHVRRCVLIFVNAMLRCYACATSIWCQVKQLSYTLIRTHTHTHSTLSLKHSTL